MTLDRGLGSSGSGTLKIGLGCLPLIFFVLVIMHLEFLRLLNKKNLGGLRLKGGNGGLFIRKNYRIENYRGPLNLILIKMFFWVMKRNRNFIPSLNYSDGEPV